MKKYACYCMTRNIYHKIVPSLRSLLTNSSVDRVFLVTEDDEIGFLIPEKVSIINVANQPFFPPDGANYNCSWTYMALMKVALCHVLPNRLDQVLSLDLDTIVAENIDEIWDTPMGDKYFAGVAEVSLSQENVFVNAGVILWNLRKMRDGMADRMIDELNHVRYGWPEQDCMNKLCRGQIYELNSAYNACRYTKPTKHPKIYHFAAIRRWYEDESIVQKWKGELV